VAISGKAKGEERHEGNAGRQAGQAAGALAEADRGSGIVSYFSSSIVTATAPTAESRTLLPSTSAKSFLSMK
jgi:hypothetical protein